MLDTSDMLIGDKMKLLLKYFWLILSVSGFINGYLFNTKIKKQIKTNQENKQEINALVKGYFILMILPCIILQFLQLAGGYKSAFFILPYQSKKQIS